MANGKHGGQHCHRQQLIIISLRIYFITGTGELDTALDIGGGEISDIGFNSVAPHVPSVFLSPKIVRNHNRISLR